MYKKFLVLLIFACLLMSCTNPNEKPYESEESSIFEVTDVENIRITKDNCNVKLGAGNNYDNIATLEQNDTADVLGTIGDWFVIRLDDNRVGCVSSNDCTPIVKEDPQWSKDPSYGPQNPAPEQETTPDTAEGTPPGTGQETPPGAGQDANQEPVPGGTPGNEENLEGRGNEVTQLSAQEQEMVDLVNMERNKNNLSPLQVDLELARVARIKSQDMVDNNYFSHYSPNYGSPFDMLKSFGIKYLHAGENIAGNSSVQRAHESLMNSSGHRKNILSTDYTHIGIGIKPSDRYGYMFTQMFISKPK